MGSFISKSSPPQSQNPITYYTVAPSLSESQSSLSISELDERLQQFREELKAEFAFATRDSTKELENLRQINSALEAKLSEKNATIDKLSHRGISNEPIPNVSNLINEISREQIDKYVEELLADERVNVKYLPDFVERELYRNIFRMGFKLANRILGLISFQFAGQQLNVGFIPSQKMKESEIKEDEDETATLPEP